MVTSFMLMLTICSAVQNQCTENIVYPKPLETHHHCVIKGYEIGLQTAKGLNIQDANKLKLFVTFTCVQQEGRTS